MGRIPFSSLAHALPKTLLALAALAACLCAQPANTILLERWDNIAGNLVTDLTNNANYPNNPTSRTYPTAYEIPINSGDNYGTRTRGYVTPPTTGNYTFWISGDDYCELWLGTNSDPATARLIANVPGYTSSRQWTKFTQQQSAAIALTAGVRYYIETRHKEGTGSDNLAVGWQGPNITGETERPIPGTRLSPFLLVTAPAITVQPANQTVNAGQTATFSVTATGSSLAYQWRRNGSNIPGATSASYTTAATAFSDNGSQYSVVVSNTLGSATSANAVLTVNAPPSITAQSSDQVVNLGQPATFTVTATGSAPLTYQWRLNGVNIAGAVSAAYSIPAVTSADDRSAFSAVVSNAFGTATSVPATLTVWFPPAITAQPTNQTTNAGYSAAFTVTATGSGTLLYQWYKNGVALPGETHATLYYRASSADNGATFYVVVSNTIGTATSATAVLTVVSPPVIILQPSDQTVTNGQTATFSVSASGTAPLAYQWRKNGVNIPGATGASYTTPATVTADNGALFSVAVSNSAASVTSGNALLTVVYVATNSRKLSVSGELADASGNPLGYPSPVTVDAIVNLYNDSAAGTSLYTESFRASAGKGIRVSNGLFVARLGEGATSQNLQQVLAANANLWVEVTVDDGTPDVLRPRTPLTAAPYALGGTPAPALAPAIAPSLTGSGDPNTLGIDGQVGATYVNSEDNSTWFKLKSAWKRLD